MKSDYCMNTLHSYSFEGGAGMLNMQDVIKMFRCGFKTIGGIEVERVLDHRREQEGLSGCRTIEYRLAGGTCVVISPSDIEPRIETSIYIASGSKEDAAEIEEMIRMDLENIIYLDYRVGYCCE